MIPSNLKKKQLELKPTYELEKIIDNSPYSNRYEAIGNHQTIQYVFEILHQRGEIDCQEAFCFENCK